MTSYEFAGRPISVGEAAQCEALVASRSSEASGVVIDLRTLHELGDSAPPTLPEGWTYRRLPLTGETASEQDLDVFRRELVRRQTTVVLGPNVHRPQLLVLAALARLQPKDWGPDQQASAWKECSQHEPSLESWLQAYFRRHQTPATPSA